MIFSRSFVVSNDLIPRGGIDRSSEAGYGKRVVFRTFPDAFTAHYAGDVCHICIFTLFVNGFDSHRAGIITCAAFRTGRAVLCNTERGDLVEQSEQIAERTDRAEKTPLEEASRQYNDHHETAGEQAYTESRQYGGNSDCRAEIAEISADKGKPQHQKEHCPADRYESPVHAIVHDDPFCLGPVPQVIH